MCKVIAICNQKGGVSKTTTTVRWSSIFVTFTLKKIIDWNISFQTVSCIHLMNVDVYDCNSHIHNNVEVSQSLCKPSNWCKI